MFKQAKKARQLMNDPIYKHDEFNWIHIILTAIFSIALVGVWYYWQKAEEKIKHNKPASNPIIKNIQMNNELNNLINDQIKN